MTEYLNEVSLESCQEMTAQFLCTDRSNLESNSSAKAMNGCLFYCSDSSIHRVDFA